jgi:tetratricopeptide (TPR) repeat protein
MAPEKKTYWQQLSSVYGQMEDYPKSLAVAQLAYNGGILTEDTDVRRLADLQLFNDAPYRCGLTLDEAVQKKLVKSGFQAVREAGELLDRGARLREGDRSAATGPPRWPRNGDLFVRLGEVQVQRNEWAGAVTALQNGLRKGGLKDPGNAQVLLGIAQYNQKNYAGAKDAFTRARNFDKHRKMADGYLQLIAVQAG